MVHLKRPNICSVFSRPTLTPRLWGHIYTLEEMGIYMFRTIGTLLLFSIFALNLAQAAESSELIFSTEHDIVDVAHEHNEASDHDSSDDISLHCVHCHAGHFKIPSQTGHTYRNLKDNKNPVLTDCGLYKSPLFEIVRPPRKNSLI